jgi:hypothetical protein
MELRQEGEQWSKLGNRRGYAGSWVTA